MVPEFRRQGQGQGIHVLRLVCRVQNNGKIESVAGRQPKRSEVKHGKGLGSSGRLTRPAAAGLGSSLFGSPSLWLRVIGFLTADCADTADEKRLFFIR